MIKGRTRQIVKLFLIHNQTLENYLLKNVYAYRAHMIYVSKI